VSGLARRLVSNPPDRDDLRAAAWAVRAALSVRRQLSQGTFDTVSVPPPPVAPPSATRGVHAVLRRTGHSCLVKSLVRQRWFAARGYPVDLIIGVTAPSEGFKAHAWLDGDADAGYRELTRRPAANLR
jgi:hypothetical protein